MNQEQFDHAVRAAGAILGEEKIIVIGSQAIFGTITKKIPAEAERSVEVDFAAINDPKSEKSDLIDGSIGELSMFHDTFGYYAQGVSKVTALLPDGWEKRLKKYKTPATNGVTALCLEIHDLWISKALANRQKDIEFCNALFKNDLVKIKTLKSRLNMVDKKHQARIDNAKIILNKIKNSKN